MQQKHKKSNNTITHHGADRAHAHVLDEGREELLAGEVLVVLLQVRLGWAAQLHRNQLETLGFESLDNVACKTNDKQITNMTKSRQRRTSADN